MGAPAAHLFTRSRGYGRRGEPARRRNLAVSPPAPRQSGRLVPLGCRGVRCRRGTQRPDPAVGGVFGLSLVSRDGPRVLRGRRGGSEDERAVRQRQGRSRGAPRRRRPLHGRRAGADRAGRLADDGVHDTHTRAVLRRHLLPEGCVHAVDGRHRRRLPQQARGRDPERHGAHQGVVDHRRAAPEGRCTGPRGPQRRTAEPGQGLRQRVGRLRPGAEVPHDIAPRADAAGLHDHRRRRPEADHRDHAGRHVLGRHVRPRRRRFRPLLHRP